MRKNKSLEERKRAIKQDYLSGFRAEESFFAGLSEDILPDSVSSQHAKQFESQFDHSEWESFNKSDEIF